MLFDMKKSVFLFLGTSLMLGCREYNLYQYHTVTQAMLGGELVLAVEGTYGKNYSEGTHRRAELSYPYTLQFMFAMPYERDFTGFKVTHIELVGDESQEVLKLPDVQSDNVKDPRQRTDPDAEARTVIATIGGLTADTFRYENYTLKATVIVLGKQGKPKQEVISIRIETDFKQEQRSDWFDNNMSV